MAQNCQNLKTVFQPMSSKTKTNNIAPHMHDFYLSHLAHNFSYALSKLHAIAGNSDRFIALLAPVVVGQSNYYSGIGFSTVISKQL